MLRGRSSGRGCRLNDRHNVVHRGNNENARPNKVRGLALELYTYNVNCLIESERRLKVTGDHVHCVKVVISRKRCKIETLLGQLRNTNGK